MKQYKITVNGQAYDVQVEETDGVVAPQPQATPVPAPQAVQTPVAPVAVEAPAQEEVASAPSGDGEVVSAPMPGAILNVAVSVGDSVNEGDVLVVLEAMKMENDIVAARAGTIVGVHVAKGDTVDAGTALVSLD